MNHYMLLMQDADGNKYTPELELRTLTDYSAILEYIMDAELDCLAALYEFNPRNHTCREVTLKFIDDYHRAQGNYRSAM